MSSAIWSYNSWKVSVAQILNPQISNLLSESGNLILYLWIPVFSTHHPLTKLWIGLGASEYHTKLSNWYANGEQNPQQCAKKF